MRTVALGIDRDELDPAKGGSPRESRCFANAPRLADFQRHPCCLEGGRLGDIVNRFSQFRVLRSVAVQKIEG
jgi:hypothetical protein